MLRVKLVGAAILGLGLVWSVLPARVHARAGKLDSPQLAIAVDESGKPDPTTIGMNKALSQSAEQFAEGGYVNAHTTLEFQGKWKHLGAMIKRLSEVEGAQIQVRITHEQRFAVPTSTQTPRAPESKALRWTINHNSWANPQYLSIDVQLDADDDDSLEFPLIQGKALKAKSD